MGSLASLLPFVIIIVIFWFLLIRPQQKKQRQVQEMQRQLEVGDTVMLTSGFIGTVTEITDDYLGVELGEGMTVRVIRAAIGQKVDPTSPLAGGTGAPADGDAAEVETDRVDDAPARTEEQTAPHQETLEESRQRLNQKPEENN